MSAQQTIALQTDTGEGVVIGSKPMSLSIHFRSTAMEISACAGLAA